MKTSIIFLVTILILSTIQTKAQIGIGTNSPNKSSMLDVQSNSKGFLLPRMTVLERNYIVNPAEGLMVFCTNCCPNGTLSFFDSKIWKTMIDCTDRVIIESDFDGDGILNVADIDDDNDGIRDELECPVEYSDFTGLNLNTNPSGSTEYITNQTVDGNTLPASITISKPVSVTPNTFGEITIGQASPGATTPNEAVIMLKNLGAEDGEEFTTEFNFSRPNGITIYADDSYARSNINYLDEFTFEPINPPSNSFNWEFLNVSNTDTTLDGYKITIFQTSGASFTDFSQFVLQPNMKIDGFIVTYRSKGLAGSNSGQFLFNLGCSDNDGDGYPNHLDLDSDNDGCSDAYESGMTVSTQTLFHFPEPYGINGLSDGIETSVDNGITIISPNLSQPYDGACP